MVMITIKQANTWSAVLQVIDSDGNPLDILLATALVILWRIGDPAAALELTEADAGVIPAADGSLTINLDTLQTALSLGAYTLEVQVSLAPNVTSLSYQVEVIDSLAYQGPGQ
jgi:hypothetical protein